MKKGFTLIEMIVVLVILAIVTHLAVREMTHIKNERMGEIAEKQFSEIKKAVFTLGEQSKPLGFASDMGRLPRAVISTNNFNRECVTLGELWEKPEGVGNYEVRCASKDNLVVGESEKNDLEDLEVWIACGWRGPYLNRSVKDSRLFDAWGNRMENKDDAGYDRLFTKDGKAAKVGDEIWKIAHYGSDGRLDSEVHPQLESQKDSLAELIPVNRSSNKLAINILFCDGEDSSPVTGDVICKWYAPCGSAITGGVEKVTLSGVASKSFAFDGVSFGQCMITVSVGGETRLRKYITVPPGGTTSEIKVPVR